MIQMVIDWVSARSDVTQIYLHVQTNNEDALKFYQVCDLHHYFSHLKFLNYSLSLTASGGTASRFSLDFFCAWKNLLVISQKHGFAVESTIEKYYQRVEPTSAFLLSRSFQK